MRKSYRKSSFGHSVNFMEFSGRWNKSDLKSSIHDSMERRQLSRNTSLPSLKQKYGSDPQDLDCSPRLTKRSMANNKTN